MTEKELIAMNEMDKDALMHHGIKGQRWGIQNGPPYPLNDRVAKRISKNIAKRGRPESMRQMHVIPKGTKIYRVSPKSSEDLSGHKYVTYLPSDRNLYKGGYLTQLKSNYGLDKNAKAYEHEFETTEDLKIPSREKVKEVSQRIMNDPKIKKESIKNAVKMFIEDSDFSEADNKFYKENTNSEEYKIYKKERDAYIKRTLDRMTKQYEFDKTSDTGWFDSVVRYLGMSSPIIKQTLIDQLSKEGYNAMVDEAGVGGIGRTAREGIEPLIVFNGKTSMAGVGKTEITDKESKKAQQEYQNWWIKAQHSKSKGTNW